MRASERLVLRVVPDMPLLQPGDDLAATIAAAMDRASIEFDDGDILVVAQKAVSKAEGRYVDLATVAPSARARELAEEVGNDPRLVEVILSESKRVVRHAPNVMIVEHRRGYIMANGGVDKSNVAPDAGAEPVLLLPEDPDGAAEVLRVALVARFGKRIGVIISDSFGRPWRMGTVGVALGAAGIPSLRDLRGQPDLFGRPLQVTETGFADEVAAAASLLMGQAAEGRPVVIVSGLDLGSSHNPAAALIRSAKHDLFR
jgi:coenzyme F420-0:L-glutamate ligase/coenzyme F420-1:gamma-L-glutamate ligase